MLQFSQPLKLNKVRSAGSLFPHLLPYPLISDSFSPRRSMTSTLAMLWAGPNSLLGVFIGCLTVLTGGKAQVRRGVLEFHGGFARWLLGILPAGEILAMTLGHVVIGVSDVALEIARDHEHVHVRQYERWGPLFLPAYILNSLWQWCKGRRPYRDNFFERQAYGEEPIGDS